MPSNIERVQLNKLKQENTALKRQVRRLEKAEVHVEEIREAIYGLSQSVVQAPEWLLKVKTGPTTPGIPNFFWSDWHSFEVVRKEEVEGHNSYNGAVQATRIKSLVANAIRLPSLIKTQSPPEGCIVHLGGDMLSGDIHDELVETNEMASLPACIKTAEWLCWALGKLADHYGKVHVLAVTGNHGRQTKKPRKKRRVETNYDYHTYCLVEKYFSDTGDTRVTFNIPTGLDAHVTVFGHTYCLTHGDSLGVRGGNAIIGVLGPVARGEIKIRKSKDSMEQSYDTLLIGHFHQYINLETVVVNGSLKGYDEYAASMRYPYAPPKQAMWVHHPERGRIWAQPIVFGGGKKSKAKHAIKEWR